MEAFHLGDPAEADELLGPESDTIDVVPAARLSYLHMDPDQPVPAVGEGMLPAELPAEAVDRLVRVAGDGAATPLLSVEIRQLGGELARARAGHGALASIEAPYAIYAVGIAPTPDAGRAVRAYLDYLLAAMQPWEASRMCLNFAETGREPSALWGDHTHRRLCRIKGRVDPDDLIRSNHPVRPA